MLYYIPIEPYETRYTADWIEDFENKFIDNRVEYTTILGKTNSTKVTNGGVLDACGTHLYKFSQLKKIIKLINNGEIKDDDVIFFADLWFPGLESLFYIRNMLKIKFKICGIFHAGTYDSHDFTYRNNMRDWGKYLEASWFSDIDMIFVATDFHKNLLINNSIIDNISNKIYVTGLPFYNRKFRDVLFRTRKSDDNILVFPHRCDEEKHPELFDKLVKWLEDKGIKFKAVKTILDTKSRDEYFELLGKSKVMVSFAEQETFGYSTLESMALNNVVVVPNKLSYTETVPDENRYDTLEECFEMVLNALTNYHTPDYSECLDKWNYSIDRMISIMRSNYDI